MARVELEIRSNGLLIDATVWLSGARRAQYFRSGREVPPEQLVTLMVDTGADTTMIREQVFRNLGLTPTGQARIHTSTSGPKGEPTNVYDVSLGLTNRAGATVWRVQPIEVLARPLDGHPFDGVIGRDLLNLWVLEYDGPKRVFRLIFPDEPTTPPLPAH